MSRAALAICHVETPMGAGAPTGYPIFNSPKELAAAIKWTGWDVCDTASNHSVDKGQAGIASTAAALDAARIRHTGSFRTAAESRRLLIVSVRGLRLAFLSYTYSTNGVPLPHPWSVNLISTAKIIADARLARKRGASLVIANLHAGNEYVHEPNAQQRDLSKYLLQRGIVDAIVGQHVHVVQPIRRIRGRFVVYGAGNLLSNQTSSWNPTRASLAVKRAASPRTSISSGPLRREGSKSWPNMSWMWGSVRSLTGKGHVSPTASPNAL
jgi:poly-gamma-glutamate capsule biosynthesis protein CapA/YwtB (metallophosphatase superfamily)